MLNCLNLIRKRKNIRKMKSLFVVNLFLLSSCVMVSQSQGPLPRLDFRKQFSQMDFTFDLDGSKPDGSLKGGEIRTAFVNDMPSLSGEGVAYSLFDVEPCGINLPHVHPRATELLYVIEGNNLRTGFVEEMVAEPLLMI